MKRSFQEIMEQATREMQEVLEQETGEDGAGQWDPDAWEEEVIRFTRQLGWRMVQTWAEVKAEQAKAQASFVPGAGPFGRLRMSGARHLHRWQPLWRLSALGRIEARPLICVAPRTTAASGLSKS